MVLAVGWVGLVSLGLAWIDLASALSWLQVPWSCCLPRSTCFGWTHQLCSHKVVQVGNMVVGLVKPKGGGRALDKRGCAIKAN